MTDLNALDLLKKELDDAAVSLEDARKIAHLAERKFDLARDSTISANGAVERAKARVGRYVAAIAAMETKDA
jgi:hypothetical protein